MKRMHLGALVAIVYLVASYSMPVRAQAVVNGQQVVTCAAGACALDPNYLAGYILLAANSTVSIPNGAFGAKPYHLTICQGSGGPYTAVSSGSNMVGDTSLANTGCSFYRMIWDVPTSAWITTRIGISTRMTNIVVNADGTVTYNFADGTSVSSGVVQTKADWNATTGLAQILNKPALAAVATSGAYADLTGRPSLASGTVTSFLTGSWPAWLVPSVSMATTTPTLAVTASAIPNSALANSSTTVGGTTCALGSTCAPNYASPDLTGTGTIPAVTLAIAGCSAAVVVSVPGAVVGHRVDVMNTDGTLPTANTYYNGAVTSAGNVSAVQCATVGLAVTAKAVTVWTR